MIDQTSSRVIRAGWLRSRRVHRLKSIGCRLAMSAYTLLLALDTARFFGEPLLLLNWLFVVLILADGLVVLVARHGLEDRWCSLALLFFVCANAAPLWTLEVHHGTALAARAHHADFAQHLDAHYRPLLGNDSRLAVLTPPDDPSSWSTAAPLRKDHFSATLEHHEALFCLVLVLSRIGLPKNAALAWSAAATSAASEFAFNTVLDVYSTAAMCREAKLGLPRSVAAVALAVSGVALLPIALNTCDDEETTTDDGRRPSVSPLRRATDTPYFQFVVQIVLTDVPLLVVRLVIMLHLKYVKNEFYYLVAKQALILVCKLTVMAHHWAHGFVRRHGLGADVVTPVVVVADDDDDDDELFSI